MSGSILSIPSKRLFINSFTLRILKMKNRGSFEGTTTDLELTDEYIILTVASWKKLFHVLYNMHSSHCRLNKFDLSTRLNGVCTSGVPFLKPELIDYYKKLLIDMNLRKHALREVYQFIRSELLHSHMQLEPINSRVSGYPCYISDNNYASPLVVVQPILMELYGADIDFLFHKRFHSMIGLLINSKKPGEFITTSYNVAESYLNPDKFHNINWSEYTGNKSKTDSEKILTLLQIERDDYNIFSFLGKIDPHEVVTVNAVKLKVEDRIDNFISLQKEGIEQIRDFYNSPFYNYVIDLDCQQYKSFEVF